MLITAFSVLTATENAVVNLYGVIAAGRKDLPRRSLVQVSICLLITRLHDDKFNRARVTQIEIICKEAVKVY